MSGSIILREREYVHSQKGTKHISKDNDISHLKLSHQLSPFNLSYYLLKLSLFNIKFFFLISFSVLFPSPSLLSSMTIIPPPISINNKFFTTTTYLLHHQSIDGSFPPIYNKFQYWILLNLMNKRRVYCCWWYWFWFFVITWNFV